ncbi:iron-containing redox enzyme family protein [Nonomuraea typhae]|uniref:Iron-containing redox enzyme family protein n=1 Tax=Nonomuraea typhae TaxID=2603600 RepID=A0ABW7ZBW5_9ACTN
MHDDGTAATTSIFRMLYARTADPEAFIPGGELVDLVRAEVLRASSDSAQPLGDLIRAASDWSTAAAERFQALGKLTDGEGRRLLVRRAALGWAPLGLASGAWLQWLTSPGTAAEPLSLRILALYASDVGVGHPGAARGSAYLGLLRQLRASENAVPLARLSGERRIADIAFRLPGLLLLMSRRPGDFRHELVGADLCLRAMGLPPPLVLARGDLRADWAAIDCSGTRDGGPSPIERCRAIADALVQDSPESAARVNAGFTWTLAALQAHTAALHDELRASLDPAYDMAELLRLRAREGSVYHRRVLLEDRPVSAWLKSSRDDPRPFLEVLARSRLVKPGRSEASPLVSGLVSDGGPMFRVFTPDDLTIIRRWIDALPSATNQGEAAVSAGRAPDEQRLAVLPGLLETRAAPGAGPSDLRDAYYLLMARTGSPELRAWCLGYIGGWLARSRHRMDSRSVPLPARWQSQGLRPWLQRQHDRHGEEFEEGADIPLPPREAVIDDAVQTAPLTLIDGSWLQGFTDYELAWSDIGHSLFATYWDELGNGAAELNHPRIYREVLKEMDVDLPPTASPEFARWPGFRDASFELPVYWLCIGRFPRTFLPEVLGLNLAMELSGVGGAYRRAGTALRKYGFSTRFVDIHNTIDNVATGHSAWAADAVDTLLSSLPDSTGPGGRSEVWERVRAGYRSLNPPSGFMARRAARRGRLAARRSDQSYGRRSDRCLS